MRGGDASVDWKSGKKTCAEKPQRGAQDGLIDWE